MVMVSEYNTQVVVEVETVHKKQVAAGEHNE